MPLVDFRQARRDIRLREALELVGFVERRRVGVQVRGPCPLHGSSPQSRSFSAHLEKNVWRCFRCGAAGNALDLWAQATGLPLYAAVVELYRRLGRPLPLLVTTPQKDKEAMNDP